MNELQFYTTLKIGWLNAWIPIFALILVQVVFMFVFKDGGKRAVDTSWYKPKDKFYAIISSILQLAIALVSLFIPLKSNIFLFTVGCVIFVISFVANAAAFYAYGKTPRGETVRIGIYRLSRNPMYLSFGLGVIATCIATASLWLLLLSIPFMLAMHGIILGEERYCTKTYGKDYLDYKKQVARYFGRSRSKDFRLQTSNYKNMNTLKRFKIYMGKRKILLPISLVLSALNGLLALVPALFVWLIVRTLISCGGSPEGTAVNQYAWWAFATAVLSVLLYFVALMLSHLAAFRVECNLRTTAVNRLLRMPLGYFDSKASGRIRKIIDDDAGNTHTLIAHTLPDLAASIVSPLLVLVLLFVFDWRMGVACLIPIGATMFIMGYLMNPKSNHFMKDYLTAQEQMSAEAVEYVRGIPVVKVFQQTVFSFRRFYDSIIRYRDLVIPYTLTWRNPMSIYTAVINGFAFFLIPVAVLMIGRGGELSVVVSDLLFYLLITPIIGANIMKLMYLQNNLFLAGEALTRIENITSTPPLPEAAQKQSIKKHDIQFENVRFAYPEATTFAVDGVSFHIPQGSTYALVGQSGGGKTTIARLIPRFWDVAEGSVKIGGVDVRNIAKVELMDNVSFVFQNGKLFKTTLLENITYGKPGASPVEIERAIDLSQSREIINRLPNGLNTKIGVDGTYLSGGEQQRIVLARAFLKDAPIVVLDEATAFADPENEHLIQQALRELMKGKTVLMIAHRLTTVQDADKILVIDKGKIAEQGTHSDLIAKNGIYCSMWNEYQKAVAWTF